MLCLLSSFDRSFSVTLRFSTVKETPSLPRCSLEVAWAEPHTPTETPLPASPPLKRATRGSYHRKDGGGGALSPFPFYSPRFPSPLLSIRRATARTPGL